MRFQPTSSDQPRPPVSRALRRRLWVLLVMLGAVGMMMQHMRKPETIDQLGRVFQLNRPAVSQQASSQQTQATPEVTPIESANPVQLVTPASKQTGVTGSTHHAAQTKSNSSQPDANTNTTTAGDPPPSLNASDLPELLAGVEDNAPFRSSEQEVNAWLGVLQVAQLASLNELKAQSVGQLAYAQLVRQPSSYRGKVVTLRGTILRTEPKRAVANDLGIEQLHQVTMAPEGGSVYPFIIYVLKLPDGFPQDQHLRVPATIPGYFFKVWSYPYENGMGLAPVIVAPTFDWQPTLANRSQPPLPVRAAPNSWWTVIAAAAAVASLLTWGAVRYTRRKPSQRTANDLQEEIVESMRQREQESL